MAMKKHWHLKEYDPLSSALLAADLKVSPVTARILSSRGLDTADTAKGFISPTLSGMLNPFLMAGMDQAVTRLLLARQQGEAVCIYGDYDVDGITATALLVAALPSMGIQADYHIPHRMDEGYGLNLDALKTIAANGYKLVVSVDCGVTALQEADFCRSAGLDLIITDHHQPLEQLPDAIAVLNPHRSDCTYPYKALAGVGVAFNLLVALRSRLKASGLLVENSPDLRQWLDLVAMGTIADMVPLTGQNRLLVAAGLKRMGDGCRIGLAALKEVSGIKGDVNGGQIGFRLAPRLNAAGRLESALPCVELLLTEEAKRAAELAQELDAANSERQQVERRIFDEAESLMKQSGWSDKRYSIVLHSPDWHPGVVGIVASRLVERYFRPTILIAENEDGSGKGSGRSIAGFHLLDTLHASAAHLLKYGGHKMAAGVTVKSNQLADFAALFEQIAEERLRDTDLTPQLLLDAELSVDELTLPLVKEIEQLAPFGMGNPEPTLLMRDLHVQEIRTVGGAHLKMKLEKHGKRFQAIGWRMAGEDIPEQVDLACTPEIDTWGEGERLQLRLKGIRPAEVNHGT